MLAQSHPIRTNGCSFTLCSCITCHFIALCLVRTRVKFTAISEDPCEEIKAREEKVQPCTLVFITLLSKTYPTNEGKVEQITQYRNPPYEAYDHWKESPTHEEKALACGHTPIYHQQLFGIILRLLPLM